MLFTALPMPQNGQTHSNNSLADNISCSMSVVRARPFCFANTGERGLRIGLHAG